MAKWVIVVAPSMARTRRSLIRRIATIAGTGLTGALTGCSGPQGGSAPTETETDEPVASSPSMSPSPTATPSTPVSVATHDTYGDILVDSTGRTLYKFAKDSDGESVCYDDCAEAWPPLTMGGDRTIDSGPAVSAELGTIQRDDSRSGDHSQPALRSESARIYRRARAAHLRNVRRLPPVRPSAGRAHGTDGRTGE